MKKNSSSANWETHESPSIDSTSVQNEKPWESIARTKNGLMLYKMGPLGGLFLQPVLCTKWEPLHHES